MTTIETIGHKLYDSMRADTPLRLPEIEAVPPADKEPAKEPGTTDAEGLSLGQLRRSLEKLRPATTAR